MKSQQYAVSSKQGRPPREKASCGRIETSQRTELRPPLAGVCEAQSATQSTVDQRVFSGARLVVVALVRMPIVSQCVVGW